MNINYMNKECCTNIYHCSSKLIRVVLINEVVSKMMVLIGEENE